MASTPARSKAVSPREENAATTIAKKAAAPKPQQVLSLEQLDQEEALLAKALTNPGLGFIESLKMIEGKKLKKLAKKE